MDLPSDFLRDAIARGRVVTGLEICRFMLAQSPQDAFLLSVYGDSLRRVGRLMEAEDALLAVKDADGPNARRAQLHLGELYESSGRFNDAEPRFRRAIELDPSSTVARIFLGGMLASAGRINEAIEIHASATQCTGDVDEAYLNLGHCHRALSDYDTAIKNYGRALKPLARLRRG